MTPIEIEAAVNSAHQQFTNARLPAHMWRGVRVYLLNGICTGAFLSAVFANDLNGAAANADPTNSQCLANWAQFCFRALPQEAYGSPSLFHRWKEKGGLIGNEETGEAPIEE